MKFATLALAAFCVLFSALMVSGYNLHLVNPTVIVEDAQTHYGDPYIEKCLSDEVNITIQDIPGAFCTPSCSTMKKCPTDMPAGFTAEPQCALQSSAGKKYCALMCSPSLPIKDQLAADESCGPNSVCQPIQSLGLCTYVH